jgi:cold shock CspA family protein
MFLVIPKESCKEYFFHVPSLLCEAAEYNQVEFELKPGKKGPQAYNVKTDIRYLFRQISDMIAGKQAGSGAFPTK